MPDTIVALSSGALPSGVAVIRLSGPSTRAILEAMTGALPEPRRLTLATVRDGAEALDQGLIAWFPAPHSFTGEDCAELQVHGSPAVVRAILRAATTRPDVRLAEAGEFTRRAFENGKLNLTEVEGLGDLIAAETEGQMKQAAARLAGGVADKVTGWRETILDLRAEIEARLDFADESDVGELSPAVGDGIAALRTDLKAALESVARGRIVREGFRVALAGPPNVGKSSLLNVLARADVAIVTDEPGTTRDVREVSIDLGGQLVVLLDMAGLRETDSKAEAEGVRRARAEIAGADLVLWLVAPDVPARPPPADVPVIKVGTKADLVGVPGVELSVSAMTGEGLAHLMEWLTKAAAERTGQSEPALLSRERDRAALEAAIEGLRIAQAAEELELTAEGLRIASQALERLLGRLDAEAVLDHLFLAFCIGK
jgi:tRNA modification GTPase